MITALSERFGDYGANDIDKSESFTLVWHDGQLTPKSVDTLANKYNLDPPC